GKNKAQDQGRFHGLIFRLAELVTYGVVLGASRRIVSAVSLSHSCSRHLCSMATAEVAPSDRRTGSPDFAVERRIASRTSGTATAGRRHLSIGASCGSPRAISADSFCRYAEAEHRS